MIEDISEKLATTVTEIVLNKTAGWRVKLDNAIEKALTQVQEEAKSDVMKVVDNYDGLPLHKKELKELFNSEK